MQLLELLRLEHLRPLLTFSLTVWPLVTVLLTVKTMCDVRLDLNNYKKVLDSTVVNAGIWAALIFRSYYRRLGPVYSRRSL